MKQLIRAVVVGTTLCAAASAMAQEVTESRQVNAGANIVHLGGAVSLNMKQGSTPSLVLTGDKELLAKVTVRQDGSTLSIDMEKAQVNWGMGKRQAVRAELTLPSLKEYTSHGVGASTVKGFSGDSLKLSLSGAGSLNGDVNYKRIDADLGGVGSVKLNTGKSERIDLSVGGTGSTTLTGETGMLDAELGGVGSLDAKDLQASSVDLSMSGIGSATVYAKDSAKVELTGLGGATVYGNPPKRSSSATGLGSVKWK